MSSRITDSFLIIINRMKFIPHKTIAVFSIVAGVFLIAFYGNFFYQYTFTTKLWFYMFPMYQTVANMVLGLGWVLCGVLLLKRSRWTVWAYNALAIASLLYTGVTLFLDPYVSVGVIFNIVVSAVILLYLNAPRLLNRRA